MLQRVLCACVPSMLTLWSIYPSLCTPWAWFQVHPFLHWEWEECGWVDGLMVRVMKCPLRKGMEHPRSKGRKVGIWV